MSVEQYKLHTPTPFRMFRWVPDGIYDYTEYLTRYVIVDGSPVHVITKMWLDNGGPDGVPGELRLKWGSYPDFPPKPPK